MIIIAMILGAIFFPIFMEEFIFNISNIEDRFNTIGYMVKYAPGAVIGMAGYLIYSEFRINKELVDLRESILQIKEPKEIGGTRETQPKITKLNYGNLEEINKDAAIKFRNKELIKLYPYHFIYKGSQVSHNNKVFVVDKIEFKSADDAKNYIDIKGTHIKGIGYL